MTDEELLRLLAGRASDWPLGLGSPRRLRLVTTNRRATGELHRFDVDDGRSTRRILVKVEAPRDVRDRRRPARLAPASGAPPSVAREGVVLQAVARQFDGLDARLGAVEVLDVLDEPPAIVMAEVPGRPLRSWILRAVLPGAARARARRAVETAGEWLRAFHSLPLEPGEGTRLARWPDIATAAAELIDATADLLGPSLASRTGAWIESALGAMPGSGPETGLLHGDFALRNVLVDGEGRVTVLDSRARWRGPVAEDLAQMIVSIRLARQRIATLGAIVPGGVVHDLELALVAGYRADDALRAALPTFELLVTLDKWVALEERLGAGPSTTVPLERALVRRAFRSRVDEIVRRGPPGHVG